MSRFRPYTLPLPLLGGYLLMLAGCGDGATAPPPDPAEILTIQGDNQLGVPGETLPAELVVEVRGAGGSAMPEQSVAFTPSHGGSAQPASAVTDQNGRVSVLWTLGSAEGLQTLTARAGDVEVQFNATATSCDDPQPLEMAVGEVESMAASGSGGCGFLLPSGAAGDRYRIGVVRTVRGRNPTPSDVKDITVQVIGRGVVGGAPARLDAYGATPAGSGRAVAVDQGFRERLTAVRAATRATHEQMRKAEWELVERMPRGSVLREPTAALRAPMAADLPDRLEIDPTTPSGCTPAGETVTALKIAEDDRLAIYQDSTQNASSGTRVTEAQAQAVLDFYRDHGELVIEEYFDGVADIDGNGKVVVFVSPEAEGNTAAFVWSGDFYSKERCPASNAGEYIFFNYELFHDITSPGPSLAMEVIAHEVKHVSSLYRRVLRSDELGSNQLHPSWVEEGSAEIAGEVASRHAWAAAGGPAMHEAVTEDHWRDPSGAVTSKNAGVLWVLLQTQGFGASQPNSIMVDPSGASSEHSFYGSSWHFHRFLGDAYGGAGSAPMADAGLFQALNDQDTPPGIDGIEQVTGRNWESLLEDYLAASMTNGQDIAPPGRAFTSYDFISAIELFCIAVDPGRWDDSGCPEQNASGPGPPGAFPWPVTTDSQGDILSRGFETATFTGPAGPAGIRVHDFTSNGTGEGAEIRVVAPSPARVVVVRLR